jgi:antitoxin FitA
MGDWCGPTVRHQLIENRGASIRDHTFRGIEKENKKKFSQERLCLLTCLLMGDPGWRAAPLQIARSTKLLPVVQLRSGVILLMGDPERGTWLSLIFEVGQDRQLLIAFRYHSGEGANMGQVLVRNLPTEVVRKLKIRAKQHRRSLQEELKEILENAAQQNAKDVQARVHQVRKLFAGRKFSDSSDLIRQDRAR